MQQTGCRRQLQPLAYELYFQKQQTRFFQIDLTPKTFLEMVQFLDIADWCAIAS
jgi:hypothetical protein